MCQVSDSCIRFICLMAYKVSLLTILTQSGNLYVTGGSYVLLLNIVLSCIKSCDLCCVLFQLTKLRPEGLPKLQDWRVPLRHIDRRVLFEYFHERLIRCVWYFGELTKLLAYRVMCYVFQVFLRITRRRRLDCTHEIEICFED